jgi:hypothetical protein
MWSYISPSKLLFGSGNADSDTPNKLQSETTLSNQEAKNLSFLKSLILWLENKGRLIKNKIHEKLQYSKNVVDTINKKVFILGLEKASKTTYSLLEESRQDLCIHFFLLFYCK